MTWSPLAPGLFLWPVGRDTLGQWEMSCEKCGTAHFTKAFAPKYQHTAHSIHFSALEATEELKTSLSYLDCCGCTGECNQSTCSLILHCRTRGLQEVVDAANEPSSLWRICVTDLDKRMIHSWHKEKSNPTAHLLHYLTERRKLTKRWQPFLVTQSVIHTQL